MNVQGKIKIAVHLLNEKIGKKNTVHLNLLVKPEEVLEGGREFLRRKLKMELTRMLGHDRFSILKKEIQW